MAKKLKHNWDTAKTTITNHNEKKREITLKDEIYKEKWLKKEKVEHRFKVGDILIV